MFGLTDKVLAIIAGAFALLFGVLLLVQTAALHKSDKELSKVKLTLSQERGAWETERLAAVTRLLEEEAKVKKAGDELRQLGEENSRNRADAIHSVNLRIADLTKRLRLKSASEATARVILSHTTRGTSTCEATKGSDGTFISIENGTDILLESGRAETIKEQLAYCEKSYEDYRTVIKSLQLLPK